MTESDIFPFTETFRRMCRVFPMRGDETAMKDTAGIYFKALRRFPLSLVQAGAEQCLQRCKHFPRPAEWSDAIPRENAGSRELRTTTRERGEDHIRAVRLRYQDEPCRCPECRVANVDHRYLRYVPEFDSDDREVKAMNPVDGSVITLGHWAHGHELARWYDARQNFINTCAKHGLVFGRLGIGVIVDDSDPVERRRQSALKLLSRRRAGLERLVPIG